ncbi:hypothetical protein FRC06_011399 [Ceratobasidium sp. 370]|nr:hypothetical protein FRC06_011399 [Ceratobasidium sp. 370]
MDTNVDVESEDEMSPQGLDPLWENWLLSLVPMFATTELADVDVVSMSPPGSSAFSQQCGWCLVALTIVTSNLSNPGLAEDFRESTPATTSSQNWITLSQDFPPTEDTKAEGSIRAEPLLAIESGGLDIPTQEATPEAEHEMNMVMDWGLVSEPFERPSITNLHLAQLQSYCRGVAPWLDSMHDGHLDELIAKPDHRLYKWVFLACLLHTMYRPQDPERTLLLFTDPMENGLMEHHKLAFDLQPPTHVLGLLHDETSESTVLCWGVLDKQPDGTFHLWMSAFSSNLETHHNDWHKARIYEASSFIDVIGPKLEILFTFSVLSKLSSEAQSLSPLAFNFLFCQLITKQLCPEIVIAGGGDVPASVFLHGEWYTSPDVELEQEPVAEDTAREEELLLHDPVDWMQVDATGPAGMECNGAYQLYMSAEGSHLLFMLDTPPGWSNQSLAPISHMDLNEGEQRERVMTTLQLFLTHWPNQHPARVAKWQQLKESSLTVECMALITNHLWLTSLIDWMDHHKLYVDPILTGKLVHQYLDDPLELQPDMLPELYDRHLLWEGMGNTGRILSLAQPLGAADGGEDTWMIIDITVEGSHIRHMETLLPPYDQIHIDICNTFAVTLIAALNQIIPHPRLVQASLKLDQQVYSLTMPWPYTEEMVGIVMIAQLCGRLLHQDIQSVDASTFCQSLCYFFDTVFQCKDVDTSFPWASLTDAHSNLLTDCVDQRVTRQQFSLAVNREASPFEMFPQRRLYQSALIVPGPSPPFFKELTQPRTSHTADMLIRGRVREAVLLGPYPSWSSEFADEQLQVPEALSLDEYSNLIHSVEGPESLEAQMIMMTGKHKGQQLKLDWLKDTIPVERD